MNGIFSFDKKDIMKYPKVRYEKILNQLNTGPNMEVAHYMERSWGSICYPLLHTKLLLTYHNIPRNIQMNQPVKTNLFQMSLGGVRVNPFARRRQFRNPRMQNYLRAMLLRRNFMRRRRRRRNPFGRF